jgi:subtilisin family serine protease
MPSILSVSARVLAQRAALGAICVLGAATLSAQPAAKPALGRAEPSRRAAPKLDDELTRRAARASRSGRSRVIVRLQAGSDLPAALRPYEVGERLSLINAYVLDLPDSQLSALSAVDQVSTAHVDRPTWATDYLSTHATAAFVAQDLLGFTGQGVGVAVIDSGIAAWHDDLTVGAGSISSYPYGNQRVSRFVDLVNGQVMPYDDHGHGTHVAGIILGNGFDSDGRHRGMAPDASVVALKVLDANGRGTVSRIVAALDWVAAHATAYNIRVVNLSAGAAVTESYWTDPLTVAARQLTERGIVVVAAAGNLGRNAAGEKQYGGILSPANAPWVLTVGASSTQGTVRRYDDALAPFSSLGPTRGDYLAKPDLVAPGYGIRSLAALGSLLATENASSLVEGTKGSSPYLSLSGTSMAAPQVSGTVALMLQANPRLTPNLVKAILQYTAQTFDGYNALEQGAGFLDALSAVRLAEFYAANTPGKLPVEPTWSRHILWGNYMLSGGYLNPRGNAWSTSTIWGASATAAAENIVWGTACRASCDQITWSAADRSGANIVGSTRAGADNIVWGTRADADNIVWGTRAGADNIVWGTDCGGSNCAGVIWGTHADENIVWGTAQGNDNIVWGTSAGADNIVWGTAQPQDNIVWGTHGEDNIVWGTSQDANIVWGTVGEDNIVWGTALDNIVWGTALDNIVWGTALDNIVWGTALDNIVWGTGADNIVWGTSVGADQQIAPLSLRAVERNLWSRFGIFGNSVTGEGR